MGRGYSGRMAGLKDFPRRGEIWQVSLDPITGHEIGKTRPALVISNDKNNEYSDTVTVLPVTSSAEKIYPFEVFIRKVVSGLKYDSKIKCNQIRTVDKIRLSKIIGEVPLKILKEVENAILIHLGITVSIRNA